MLGAAQDRDHLLAEQLDRPRAALVDGAAQDRQDVAGAAGAALRDDLLGHLRRRARDELVVVHGEARLGVEQGGRIGFHPRVSGEHLAGHLLGHARRLARLGLAFGNGDVAADRQLLRPAGEAEPVGLGAVGVEDLPDARDRLEGGADLGPAPGGPGGRGRAHHRRPLGRRGLLQGPRHDAQVVEVPVAAVVRDHRLGEPGVEDRQGLVEALPVLFRRHADLDQLLRHAAGAADLQPPAGEMVEHADLLQHAPGLVERQHHAHGAEPSRSVERAMLAISRLGEGL